MSASIEQIRAFVAVAECGSFSAAARELGRDRSTLSQVISNLEIDLDYELFERSQRSPVLTPQGQALFVYAKNLAEYSRSFDAISRSLGMNIESELTVYYSAVIAPSFIINTMKALRLDYPKVRIHWLQRNLENIRAAVKGGEADLGIVLINNGASISQIDFSYLLSMSFCIVCTPSHALAKFDTPSLDELKLHHQLLLEDFLTSGLQHTTILSGDYQRIESLDLLMGLLRSGDGWALLPNHAVKADIEQGSLVKLNIEALNVDLQLPISLWSQAQGEKGPIKQRLMEIIKQKGRVKEE